MPNSLSITLLYLLPAITSLLVITLIRLHLKAIQGVFLLAGAAMVLIDSSIALHPSLTAIIGVMLAAEAVHLLLLAVCGTKLSHTNYGAILIAVGLTPWWFGVKFSSIYIAAVVIITVLYKYSRKIWEKNKPPLKTKTIKSLRSIDKDSERSVTSTFLLTTPFMLSLFTAAVLSR